MKRFLLLFPALMIGVFISANTIKNFNYQAIVRNSEGELVANQSVQIQLTIIDAEADGDEIYSETHTVTTNEVGLINLSIGTGTSNLGTFESIQWGENSKFMKVEIDLGSGFTDMGTFQLQSVPYANYAFDVENKDDADADPTNEIQDLNLTGNILTITNKINPTEINLAPFQGDNTDEQELSLSGTSLSISGGNTIDVSSLLDGVDDADNDPVNEIQTLTFLDDTLQISSGNKIAFPYDSSLWSLNGNKVYYNTGNVGIGSVNPVSNLEVKANSAGTDALFQVINASNDTVFAVYPDGVKIFINDEAKGKVGGFAVSGRNPSKSEGWDILKVTMDSTRIYVNESATKAKVGGFAVSGRNPSKGSLNEYLQINKDSTRIYISETTGKGKVGGFAVSGRNPSKSDYSDYFNVSGNLTAEIIDPSEPRILWYPNKEAFLTGRVLVESADSVGTNSLVSGFESKAIGDYSQAMGYRSISRGTYSMAVGNNAIAGYKDTVSNAYSFGSHTKALNHNSIAIGDSATASGLNSVALGSAFRDFELVVGGGDFTLYLDAPGAEAVGANSVAIGSGTYASGIASVAIGAIDTVTANYATALGFLNNSTAEGATVSGGRNNKASDEYATIGGGLYNIANYYGATVGGGESNQATDLNATVGGGLLNKATGAMSVIAGGYSNQATATQATVAGGLTNYATGSYSAIGGGRGNQAVGNYSFIGGGYYNEANSYGESVFGIYSTQVSGNATSWVGGDRLFVVGNGTAFLSRNDALVIYKSGNVKFDGNLYPDTDGGNNLGISSNRWNTVYATNGTINTSDLRLKSNIGLLSYGLMDIMKLRPVIFNWKGKENDKQKIGLIAQEVDEVIEEVVHHGDDENETLGINYSDLIPVLIKGIQEQQVIIQEQTERINQLENKIQEIEELLKND